MGPGNLQIELKSVRPLSDEARVDLVFSEPVSGPPKVNLRHRNKKKSVKNVDRTRTEASNCANMVQDQITVRLKQHFANELLWWPAYVNNGGHSAL